MDSPWLANWLTITPTCRRRLNGRMPATLSPHHSLLRTPYSLPPFPTQSVMLILNMGNNRDTTRTRTTLASITNSIGSSRRTASSS